jgi:hypothetical protein
MENQLLQVINESGLDKTKAQVLLENFSSYFEIAADWENKARALTVTSIEQKAEMKMAREGRLFLKEKRVNIEKTRKMLKESALREGQTIDAIAKILTNLISPIEKDLEEKEKFAEIQEANRRAALRATREAEITIYAEFLPFGLDFGDMDEDSYRNVFNGAKLQYDARVEAIRKEEEARVAREKAEAEERERVRIENERLKAEAEKQRQQLERAEAEKRAIEEKARKEREERDSQEAKRLAEQERIQKEAHEEEERAKNAPDKDKLIQLSKSIKNLAMPEVATAEAKEIIYDTKQLLDGIVLLIENKAMEM